jgi:hypothetical protein
VKSQEVYIPPVEVPQPDGSVLVKPGKPMLIQEMIGTKEAARILGRSRGWIIAECESEGFKTACRPGTKARSWWKLALAECLKRRESFES